MKHQYAPDMTFPFGAGFVSNCKRNPFSYELLRQGCGERKLVRTTKWDNHVQIVAFPPSFTVRLQLVYQCHTRSAGGAQNRDSKTRATARSTRHHRNRLHGALQSRHFNVQHCRCSRSYDALRSLGLPVIGGSNGAKRRGKGTQARCLRGCGSTRRRGEVRKRRLIWLRGETRVVELLVKTGIMFCGTLRHNGPVS